MTALHCKEYLNITESVIVTLWRPAKHTKKSPNDIVINAGDYYDYYSQSVLIGYTE